MEPNLNNIAEFSIATVFQQITALVLFVAVLMAIAAGVRNWSKIESIQLEAMDSFAPFLSVLRWWTGSICRVSIVIMISVCILGICYGSRGF